MLLRSFLATLKGEKIQPAKEKVDTDEFINDDHDFGGVMNTEDIVYGYCTEIMVRFGKDKKAFDEEQFREDISSLNCSSSNAFLSFPKRTIISVQ